MFSYFSQKHIWFLVSYVFGVERSGRLDFTSAADNRSRVLKNSQLKVSRLKTQKIVIEFNLANHLQPFSKLLKVQSRRLRRRNLNCVTSTQDRGKIS